VLNWIWIILVVSAIAYGGALGTLGAVNQSIIDSAKAAVNIVIGLVGVMAIFLGAMRVAFDGGLRDVIARAIAPALRRLFPDVPPDHPAMGAMIVNMSSNALGLGNAATPFGLKAMAELAKLNPFPGVASNPMVLFLAINTSQLALVPLGTVSLRAIEGSADPWAIWVPSLIASGCATLAGIAAFYFFGQFNVFKARPDAAAASQAEVMEIGDIEDDSTLSTPDASPWRLLAGSAAGLLILGVMCTDLWRSDASGVQLLKYFAGSWLTALFFGGMVLYGFAKGVRVYESAVAGAKDGLEVGIRITPFLIVILVSIGMLRASGALDALIGVLDPITSLFGVPAEVLPMALVRPLSGTGALGVMSEIMINYGPDSFVGQLSGVLMGSTETTFYVLALYYGAAGVVVTRHTVLACLTADFAGFCGAVAASHWWFS